MKTGQEEPEAPGWGSGDIEYIYRRSRRQHLSHLTDSIAGKKKGGKNLRRAVCFSKVGQYEGVQQVSWEEKPEKKEHNG